MSLLRDFCRGPCETCKMYYTGCYTAGDGDDGYVYASPKWIKEYKKEQAIAKEMHVGTTYSDPPSFDYFKGTLELTLYDFNERLKKLERTVAESQGYLKTLVDVTIDIELLKEDVAKLEELVDALVK